VDVSDCDIKDNKATNGAGVYIHNTDVSIDNSTVSGNTATTSGGGIFIGGFLAVADMTNITVRSNTATFGGGLYATQGFVTINDGFFMTNLVTSPTFAVSSGSCDTMGGCFYSPNFLQKASYTASTSNAAGCTIEALDDGSLEVKSFLTATTVTTKDYVSINAATYYDDNGPDGVDVSSHDLIYWVTYTGLEFTGFEVCFQDGASGGGVFNADADLSMSNTIVAGNQATRYGGGLHIAGGANYLSHVTVYGNSADLDGIELYFAGGSFEGVALTVLNYDKSSFSGTSIQSASSISDCIAGQYATCDVFSTSDSCFVNCNCSNCPAGKYSNTVGSTSSDDCISCTAGKYSEAKGALIRIL
jgi:predicted outer membrane repeat protein